MTEEKATVPVHTSGQSPEKISNNSKVIFEGVCTVIGARMLHRNWRESKQQLI